MESGTAGQHTIGRLGSHDGILGERWLYYGNPRFCRQCTEGLFVLQHHWFFKLCVLQTPFRGSACGANAFLGTYEKRHGMGHGKRAQNGATRVARWNSA